MVKNPHIHLLVLRHPQFVNITTFFSIQLVLLVHPPQLLKLDHPQVTNQHFLLRYSYSNLINNVWNCYLHVNDINVMTFLMQQHPPQLVLKVVKLDNP